MSHQHDIATSSSTKHRMRPENLLLLLGEERHAFKDTQPFSGQKDKLCLCLEVRTAQSNKFRCKQECKCEVLGLLQSNSTCPISLCLTVFHHGEKIELAEGLRLPNKL